MLTRVVECQRFRCLSAASGPTRWAVAGVERSDLPLSGLGGSSGGRPSSGRGCGRRARRCLRVRMRWRYGWRHRLKIIPWMARVCTERAEDPSQGDLIKSPQRFAACSRVMPSTAGTSESERPPARAVRTALISAWFSNPRTSRTSCRARIAPSAWSPWPGTWPASRGPWCHPFSRIQARRPSCQGTVLDMPSIIGAAGYPCPANRAPLRPEPAACGPWRLHRRRGGRLRFQEVGCRHCGCCTSLLYTSPTPLPLFDRRRQARRRGRRWRRVYGCFVHRCPPRYEDVRTVQSETRNLRIVCLQGMSGLASRRPNDEPCSRPRAV
jgi:hypothetical protein